MFFRPPTNVVPTRLNQTIMLKPMVTILNALHDKECELKYAADKQGINSIDYYKYAILTKYTTLINALKIEFNQKESTTQMQDELQDSLLLTRGIQQVLASITRDEIQLLLIPRNHQRRLANGAIELSVMMGAIATAFSVPLSLLQSTFFILSASKISDVSLSVSGLSNMMPMTCRLLLALSNTTKQLYNEILMQLAVQEDAKSHYEVLQVSVLATDKEIKNAYRKLLLIHHPDKGGDKDTFIRINEAYQVLSQAEQRAKYDDSHAKISSVRRGYI